MTPTFDTAPTRNGTGAPTGNGRYGAASIHDFDNPSKWVTVPDVKVLDEHELDGDDGKPAAYVDRAVLEEIARNNNNRVYTTGDPAPLIVGHTSDDPQAPERPVVGYAVNYRVKESRDPKTGRAVYAIHTDYKVRKDREHVIEDFPRRSVELWLGRKELDPIALLGGTTPERDLGVIIRKSRISGFTLDRSSASNGIRSIDRNTGPALHYRKGTGTVIRYALSCDAGDDDQATNYSHGENAMKTMKGKSVKAPGGKVNTKHSYEADPDNEMATDDLPPDMEPQGDEGDSGFDGDPGADAGSEDPQIAAMFQSKAFQSMLAHAVKTAIEGLLAEEGGAGGGPGAGPTAPPMGGGEPDGDEMPPEGADGLAPQPDEEARIDHEAPPVRFGASTGYGGPASSMIPSTGTMGKRSTPYSRNGSSTTMNRTQQRNPELVRMSRQLADQKKTIQDLLIRNARIEAEKIISDFENNSEGHEDGPVVFGDRDQEIEVLTAMDPQSREYHVNNIRVNYRRAGHTNGPTDSRSADQLFRHSRTGDGNSQSDDEYEPKSAQEAAMLADAQTGRFTNGKPMALGEAVKYMRERAAKQRQQNAGRR